MKHLILTGFMGSGKSTSGRLVAPLVPLSFVDSDDVFESQTGLHPFSYITRFGIPAFRKIEKCIVRKLLAGKPAVLATGGGAIFDPVNRAMMLSSGVVICLSASPTVLMRRVLKRALFPKCLRPATLVDLKEMLAQREPYYRRCHARISTSHADPKEVAFQIIQKYKQLNRHHAPRSFE